jgi:hypothetical protein
VDWLDSEWGVLSRDWTVASEGNSVEVAETSTNPGKGQGTHGKKTNNRETWSAHDEKNEKIRYLSTIYQ